jgi:hypothetical protein
MTGLWIPGRLLTSRTIPPVEEADYSIAWRFFYGDTNFKRCYIGKCLSRQPSSWSANRNCQVKSSMPLRNRGVARHAHMHMALPTTHEGLEIQYYTGVQLTAGLEVALGEFYATSHRPKHQVDVKPI